MCAERMKLAVQQRISPLNVFAKNSDSLPPTITDLHPPDMQLVTNNARRRGALGG